MHNLNSPSSELQHHYALHNNHQNVLGLPVRELGWWILPYLHDLCHCCQFYQEVRKLWLIMMLNK